VFNRLCATSTDAPAEFVLALHELEKNLITSKAPNVNLGLFDCA